MKYGFGCQNSSKDKRNKNDYPCVDYEYNL